MENIIENTFYKTIWHFTLVVKKGKEKIDLQYYIEYAEFFQILQFFDRDKNFEIVNIYGEIDELPF